MEEGEGLGYEAKIGRVIIPRIRRAGGMSNNNDFRRRAAAAPNAKLRMRMTQGCLTFDF